MRFRCPTERFTETGGSNRETLSTAQPQPKPGFSLTALTNNEALGPGGIHCLERFEERGRLSTEEKNPTLVQEIHGLAAPHSDMDIKTKPTPCGLLQTKAGS